MRIPCPLCGPRDRREFYYYGAADYLDRPAEGAPAEAWHDYLHLRDNPAGRTRDLWYHELGCSAWIVVDRDTVTHEVHGAVLVADHQRHRAKFVWQVGDLRALPAAAVPPARPARRKPAPAPKSPPDDAPAPPKPRRGRAPRRPKGGAA